jgi:hypothetical protein
VSKEGLATVVTSGVLNAQLQHTRIGSSLAFRNFNIANLQRYKLLSPFKKIAILGLRGETKLISK